MMPSSSSSFLATLSSALLLLATSATASASASASSPPTFTIIPLPYPLDALEPAISNETVFYHYGKHVPKYVADLNAALEKEGEGSQLSSPSSSFSSKSSASSNSNETLTALVKSAREETFAVRNNAGGVWNHALYFNQFRPKNESSQQLPAELKREVDKSFGSFGEMVKELEAASLSVFGSGWAWLVWTGDRSKPLAIEV